MSIEKHPPPSLQKLVEAHGGYDKITPDAWVKFDADMARWKALVRSGGLHDPPSRPWGFIDAKTRQKDSKSR